MNPLTFLAIYVVVWWTVLFAVLPLGARSHHEDGAAVPGGGDPGSPTTLNLKRKLLTTTWVSGLVFLVLMIVLRFAWPAARPA